MTTIAYMRISTDKQDEASQKSIIAGYSTKNAAPINTWLADTASGGTPWQSRAIAGALASLGSGDTLITSEISRIARSTVGVLTFLQEAATRGVTVVAVKSGIKLDGSISSKIVVTVLALAAEIERDLLRERTRGSMQARRDKGLRVGRQPGAKGKKNKLDGRMQEIQPMLDAKVSKAAIARILKVSRTTLDKFLNSSSAETAGITKPLEHGPSGFLGNTKLLR